MNQLPKSISDFTSGKTDCPVYERIANNEEIKYLIDLRNCIMHYRTFATSDNSVIIKEGTDLSRIEQTNGIAINTMARGSFRITEDNNVVFNYCLPDTIFDKEISKKLSDFIYKSKRNALAESMIFLRAIFINYIESFALSLQSPEKRFNYDRTGNIIPVEYKRYPL